MLINVPIRRRSKGHLAQSLRLLHRGHVGGGGGRRAGLHHLRHQQAETEAARSSLAAVSGVGLCVIEFTV